MNILVMYSSGYGATFEISQFITEIISHEKDTNVTLSSIDVVSDLSKYDSIIIGTSIRADKPLANTRDFFAKYHQQLAQKNIALFLVCLAAVTPEGKKKALEEYAPFIFSKYPNIHPVAVEAFAGKIDFKRLNPVMQNLVKYVTDKLNVPANGSIDARDWNAIREWTRDLLAKLWKKKDQTVTQTIKNNSLARSAVR